MKIKMSKAQASRMGTPHLEGEIIECVMPSKEEVKKGRNAKVAKDVYFKGKRIGGEMNVEN